MRIQALCLTLALATPSTTLARTPTSKCTVARGAPKTLPLTQNVLLRPVQRFFGKTLHQRSRTRNAVISKGTHYSYDKTSGKLVRDVVSVRKRFSDGTRVQALRIYTPKSKRVERRVFEQLYSGSGSVLKRLGSLVRGVDLTTTTTAHKDGRVVQSTRLRFADAVGRTLTVKGADGRVKTARETITPTRAPTRR